MHSTGPSYEHVDEVLPHTTEGSLLGDSGDKEAEAKAYGISLMPANETLLLFNEAGLRSHVVNLLRQDGYEVQTEVQLPERFRVDIYAQKEGVTRAIEVKRESRGIADDIIKCQKLLQFPEVTEAYVAAPDLLISPDHLVFASSIGVGVISVTSSELKWVAQSWRLEEARLGGSRSYPSSVATGQVFEVKVTVSNQGKKIARHLEGRWLPAGPFAFATGSKRKYARSSLHPDDSWVFQFLIKVRPKTTPGAYPLFTIATAQNVRASESTFNIKVMAPDSTS